MIKKILDNAKEDLPLYYKDFENFWKKSNGQLMANDADLYDVYLSVLKVKSWKQTVNIVYKNHYDTILNELFEDINASLFLAMFGLYRSAHMHLRSIIELTLQLLYFIHHPIEFERWKNGDFVIKFDKLQEYFLRHPSFDIDISSIMDQILKNWKNYSKHIHGEAPIFFQCEKDVRKTNSFSKKDFGLWKSNFYKNIYLLNKFFLLFFKREQSRFTEPIRVILFESLKEADIELLEINK